ncbi:putative selenate ABC transporter substrate-binding protein [uncultured Phycicoccus sp.]|uniref:putative selenate ABC transporter substrate-binding protein n=1 Tax=uncultured Phycicoccus sp. TaxID=661422 RepID=UPI0026309D59|nr:putative selenate ABC transporter substrate-binding protein [uncultured Phycicoccus sp.]
MTPSLPRRHVLIGSVGVLALAACGADETASPAAEAGDGTGGTLVISAIPDQDPEKLGRLYPALAALLADATGLEVTYQPVTDYPAVVRGFEVGDIGLSWMGGLTGVQARSRVPGARAIAQRDIDADFHSVFIANTAAGIAPFTDAAGLTALAGHSFTFGSETSTSGRLMPQYFMEQGGLAVADLKGEPGFSGSHDATVEAVASGSFEVGAVNEQVWKAAQEAGEVDLSEVVELWRTPGYADYHWLARPDLDERLGEGTTQRITDALLALDAADPRDAEVLDLFGATTFVPTENANYDQIESVAEELGLLA